LNNRIKIIILLLFVSFIFSFTLYSTDKKIWTKDIPNIENIEIKNYKEFLPNHEFNNDTAIKLNAMVFEEYKKDNLIKAAK
jgi:hypothetical protein